MSEITEPQQPGQSDNADATTFPGGLPAQHVSPLARGLRSILEGLELPDASALIGDPEAVVSSKARKGQAWGVYKELPAKVTGFLDGLQHTIDEIGALCDQHEGNPTMVEDLARARAEQARLTHVANGLRTEFEGAQKALTATRRKHREDLETLATKAQVVADDEEMARRVMADFDRLTGWGLIPPLRTQGSDGHLTFEYDYTAKSSKGTGVYTIDCRGHRLRVQLVEGGQIHSFAIDAEGIVPGAWKELWTHLALCLMGTQHTMLGLPTERVTADTKAATTPSMRPAASETTMRAAYVDLLFTRTPVEYHLHDGATRAGFGWGSLGIDPRTMGDKP